MSKTAAAIASCCPLPAGGLPVVVAALLFLPAAALAASADPALRRSDQIDLRRLGKVSEDERSVLRVEWRAGLAGGGGGRAVLWLGSHNAAITLVFSALTADTGRTAWMIDEFGALLAIASITMALIAMRLPTPRAG